jgi:hypothetical protein
MGEAKVVIPRTSNVSQSQIFHHWLQFTPSESRISTHQDEEKNSEQCKIHKTD